MPLLQLTRNHSDHSTDRGYQFEFYCDRCGVGFISEFKPFAMTMAGGAGSAHTSSAVLPHDKAFRDCMAEAALHFRQCPGCEHRVCAASCWNAERERCLDCASI